MKKETKKQTSGNILIARFMGLEVENETVTFRHSDYADTHEHISSFPYHSEWRILMPVMEKIMKLAKVDMKNNSVAAVCVIYNRDYDNRGIEAPKLIDAVFKSAVDFIQWYNQSKK